MVNVSKKNVAFEAFAVMDPRTPNVSFTFTFAAKTFVVVTEFETTKFAKG